MNYFIIYVEADSIRYYMIPVTKMSMKQIEMVEATSGKYMCSETFDEEGACMQLWALLHGPESLEEDRKGFSDTAGVPEDDWGIWAEYQVKVPGFIEEPVRTIETGWVG